MQAGDVGHEGVLVNRGSGRIDLVRVLAVAGLLVLAGVAFAARRGRSFPGASAERPALATFGFLVLVIGCWSVTYLLVVRGLRPSRQAKPVAALLATAAFGITAALVMANAGDPPARCDYETGDCASPTPAPTPTITAETLRPEPSTDGFSLPVGPLLAVVAALLLLALASVMVLGRRRPTPLPEEPAGTLTHATLRSAVEAAGYALRLGEGPRDAVIACYVAMERAIAEAGATPLPSDTPAEVLTRAADAGLIRGSAAEALTAIFRRARFSRHPITEDHLRQAGEALTAVRDDLGAVEEDV